MIDVYSICFCYFYHRIYKSTGLCSVRSITDQPVLSPDSTRTDRIFTKIIRKTASPIFQIGSKIGTAVLDVSDCLIHTASADRSLLVKPRQKAFYYPMSLSYHRQADLAFAQKQVEEFSSACFLSLPNTNRQIFICLKKLYSLIQIYATLYKKP